MDVALHKAGVTFVLDRAGLTGVDGASHNGVWDLAMLRIVPGLRLAAPRDEPTLRDALRVAVDIDDAPSVVRYPKGALSATIPAVDEVDGVDVLARHEAPVGAPSVLVVSIGSMAGTALATGELLAAHGLRVTVVDPRWALPVPSALVKLAGDHDHVVTLEDGVVDGGIGSLLAQRTRAAGLRVPVQPIGVPLAFLGHASTEQLTTDLRLQPQDIARDVLTALDPAR